MLIFGGIVFLGLGQLVKGLRVGVLGPLAYLPQGLLVAPANEGGWHGLTAHVVFLVSTVSEFFTGVKGPPTGNRLSFEHTTSVRYANNGAFFDTLTSKEN